MPKTLPLDAPFKTNEKVRATEDLRDVPRGMNGKVQVANGMRWRRYWVRFENGVSLGQIDQAKLVRAKDWDRWESAGSQSAVGPAGGDGAEDGATAAAVADGGAGVAVNGVTVPQKLLDRSASARSRLGV